MSTESLQLVEPSRETRQPNARSIVWQANPLALACYRANEVQQKLILYAIAMIDADATSFSRYRINVTAYADACGIASNDLYKRLRTAVEEIAASPLLIKKHINQEGKEVELLTHWFSEAEFGPGFIDITFPSGLKKYLLEVRDWFYKFDLGIPLQFSGEHSIRLYQWVKSWKYQGHPKTISVKELRYVLGLVDLDTKGNVVKERFAQYGDLKTWALTPAVNEVNRASDIFVSIKEVKAAGTKRVESITFSAQNNPAYQPDPNGPNLLPGAKVAAPVDPAKAALAASLQAEFAVSPLQARRIVGKHSAEYIEAKAAIVRSEPRKNAAAYLLSALKEDWQPAKKTGKSAKKAAVPALAVEPEPVLTPEEETAKAERARLHFAGMKKKLKGGPKSADEGQHELTLTPAA